MTTTNIESIAQVLLSHGEAFHGGVPGEVAADWAKYGFAYDEVDEWCNAEVWDPSTANELQLAGMTPASVKETAVRMVEENGAGCYTSGCPQYAASNGDMSVKEIIAAWRAKDN